MTEDPVRSRTTSPSDEEWLALDPLGGGEANEGGS